MISGGIHDDVLIRLFEAAVSTVSNSLFPLIYMIQRRTRGYFPLPTASPQPTLSSGEFLPLDAS